MITASCKNKIIASCNAKSTSNLLSFMTKMSHINFTTFGKESCKAPIISKSKVVNINSWRQSSLCILNEYYVKSKKLIILERCEKVLNIANSLCLTKVSTHQMKRDFNNKSNLALPILTLYTKNPCPLCDEALEHLGPFLNQVNLQKVDITLPGNEDLWKAYCFDIPVFHLNGKFIMKHKADLTAFETALNEYYGEK